MAQSSNVHTPQSGNNNKQYDNHSTQPNATLTPVVQVCPNCRATINKKALFCTSCGQKVPPEPKPQSVECCPGCHAVLPEGAVFCSQCGHKIAPSQPTLTAPDQAPQATTSQANQTATRPTPNAATPQASPAATDQAPRTATRQTPNAAIHQAPQTATDHAPRAAQSPPRETKRDTTTARCPACGFSMFPEDEFCGRCGHSLIKPQYADNISKYKKTGLAILLGSASCGGLLFLIVILLLIALVASSGGSNEQNLETENQASISDSADSYANESATDVANLATTQETTAAEQGWDGDSQAYATNSDETAGYTYDASESVTNEELAAGQSAWRDNYTNFLCACSQRLNGDTMDEPSYTNVNNSEPVSFESVGWGGYFLYDLNGDNVPELFLQLGEFEATTRFYLFTYNGAELVYISMLPGGHTAYGGLPTAGILRWTAHMGHESISIITLDGYNCSSQEILSHQVPQGEDYCQVDYLSTCPLSDGSGLNWTENPSTNNQQIIEAAQAMSAP